MQNDIAVLRHNAFSLGGAVAALPPRTSMPSDGAAVRICGWGNTAVSPISFIKKVPQIMFSILEPVIPADFNASMSQQSQPPLATALTPMLVPFCLVCSAPVLWQEVKTLVKETLVDQSNMETISLAPPHGAMDVLSETDQEFMLMSHITAAGSILNNKVKPLSEFLSQKYK